MSISKKPRNFVVWTALFAFAAVSQIGYREINRMTAAEIQHLAEYDLAQQKAYGFMAETSLGYWWIGILTTGGALVAVFLATRELDIAQKRYRAMSDTAEETIVRAEETIAFYQRLISDIQNANTRDPQRSNRS